MCVSPVSIPNPNFGKTGFWYQLKDTVSRYIRINCGYCAECIALKQMYLIQRLQMETLKNRVFFATLTYSDEFLPHYITDTGYRIAFADIAHMDLLLKRMNNSGLFPGLRVCYVSEFGGKKGRPHFHCLFLIPKTFLPDFSSCINMEKTLHDFVFEHWSVNRGSRTNPYYVPMIDYHERWFNGKLYKNYDLHYVNPSLTENGVDDVAWYVLKYMLKSSPREVRLQQALKLNLSEDSYNEAWKIVKPRVSFSYGFGLNGVLNGRKVVPDNDIVQYLKSGISRTPRDFGYPFYYVPTSGIHFPLSRFYKSKGYIFSAVDALDFFYNNPDPDRLPELSSGYENLQTIKKYEQRLSLVDEHGSDCYFSKF